MGKVMKSNQIFLKGDMVLKQLKSYAASIGSVVAPPFSSLTVALGMF